MAKNGKRVCACGCKESFTPKRAWQKFKNKAHRNRHGQAQLRKRYKEMQAELDEQALAGGL